MKRYQEGGTTAGPQLGQSSSLSPWVGPYVTEMLGRGAALGSMPYTAYQGPLTAGPSGLQRQAFQGLANLTIPTANRVGSFAGSMPSYGPAQPPQGGYTDATGQKYVPRSSLAPPGTITSMDMVPVGGDFGDALRQQIEGGRKGPSISMRGDMVVERTAADDAFQDSFKKWQEANPNASIQESVNWIQQNQPKAPQGGYTDGTGQKYVPRSSLFPPGTITAADMVPTGSLFGNVDDAMRQQIEGGRKGPPGMTDAIRKQLMESAEAQKPDYATSMPIGGALRQQIESWGMQAPQAPQAPQQGNLGYEGPVVDMGNGMARQVIGMQAPQAQQSVAQQYMNPYMDLALRPQMEEARRQAQIEQQNLQSRYGRAGAYGGSRQAIAESELSGALQRNLANIYGTGMQQAYDKAADMFNQERQYGLQALQAQQQGGAQQRAIEQEGILADIAQFEEERDYPYKQVQYMQSLLQGLPISTQSYQYAEPSGLSNFMSGAGGILDFLKEFGLLGKT